MDKILRAIVVDNQDPDQLSRVKVKILPELVDIADKDLPWADPYYHTTLNASKEIGKHEVPEIDSRLWVKVNWVTNDFEYLHGEYIEGFNIFSKWADIESNITDIDSQSYPQPQFELFPDGSISFYNSEDGTRGIYNTNGTYFVFNADGDIFFYSKDKSIKLYNDEISLELVNDGVFNITSTSDITFQNDNAKVELLNDTKKVTIEAGTTVKGTFDGTANTFKLEDGTNLIESGPSGLNLNNHLSILP